MIEDGVQLCFVMMTVVWKIIAIYQWVYCVWQSKNLETCSIFQALQCNNFLYSLNNKHFGWDLKLFRKLFYKKNTFI